MAFFEGSRGGWTRPLATVKPWASRDVMMAWRSSSADTVSAASRQGNIQDLDTPKTAEMPAWDYWAAPPGGDGCWWMSSGIGGIDKANFGLLGAGSVFISEQRTRPSARH